MAYSEVTFHVHEQDLVKGLTVVMFSVAESLIPFTWEESRPLSKTRRRLHDIVDVNVYGGTQEQFEHAKEQHAAYCQVHGWQQGEYLHLPKAFAPAG